MCGITGFVDFSKKLTINELTKASIQLIHRGRDSKGEYFNVNTQYSIGLAARRLAIIDPSDEGNQPFISTCQNYLIVFNGIIYNYKELQVKLKAAGYIFRTNTDTEVLLNTYIQWKDSFLDIVNGIFSFCIYDKTTQQLLIARDRIGVKPLFYSYDAGAFYFGSEISALKSFSINRTINKNALNLFLKFGYFTTAETIFNNIYKLEPAQTIKLDLKTKEVQKTIYWSKSNHQENFTDLKSVINKTHQLLKQSILSRTISDVPYGVLLSGGYDSSTTTAIIQSHSKNPIHTYSIGFENESFNEAKDAKEIAKFLGTNHQEYYLSREEGCDIIKNLGNTYDEPIGDSGSIALFAATKLASKDVKVLLSSEGGDELFGGYPSYFKTLKWYKYLQLMPNLKALNKINPKLLSLIKNQTQLEFYINLNSYFTEIEIEKLTSTQFEFNIKSSNSDQLNTLLEFDLNNYLPEDLLMKADRNTMFCGIENRDPFLDNELVNYVTQIPQKFKIYNNQPKYILKQITHNYIPEKLMLRPKKGFSIPVEEWLKNDLKNFVMSNLDDSSIFGLVNPTYVNIILKKFYEGKKGYARKVWILLSLKLWADHHYN